MRGNEHSGHRIPLIVLGGSDREPGQLPVDVRDKHPLAGYKAAKIRIGGRPLAEVLVRSLRESGRFDPIYLAGPSSIYRSLDLPVQLIDTNGSFGENIEHALEFVRARHPGRSVGFITSDVLPEPETLQRVVDDFRRRSPCDLWCPMIRLPQDQNSLGASKWKPAYRVVPDGAEQPVGVLPGHLVIVDPEALRLRFLYKLFQLAYATRNRPIRHRRGVMLRGVILVLLYQDLLHLLSLRLPNLTWSVLRAGLPAARKLQRGTITCGELEDAVRRMFVKHAHLRRHPRRRVCLPVLDPLSLALDIDTEEEVRQAGGKLHGAAG